MQLKGKKVLIVNFSNVYGGQERYVRDLVSLFSDAGTNVFYCGYKLEGYLVSYGPTFLPKSQLSKENFDIVIFNGNNSLYQTIFSRVKSNFALYVQHSSIYDNQAGALKIIIRRYLLKFLLLRVNLIVRVSKSCLPSGFSSRKIVTVNNGVDFPFPYERRKKQDEYVNILMVGSVNENKNQKLAIELLTKSNMLRLTIVGDGKLSEDLKLHARALGVSDQIIWNGFSDNVMDFYAKADFYLMLSHNEAFPYVVLESMSVGTPVISANVGGVAEVIKSGHNGFILDKLEIEKLSQLIFQVSENKDFYNLVSKNAMQTISKRFTKEVMFDNLINNIEQNG